MRFPPVGRDDWLRAPDGLEPVAGGSVTTPPGFRAGGVACGLKRSGALELGILAADRPVASALVVDHYPDVYLSMGLATENVARKFEVTREEQDEFALRSHTRAAAALDAGKFKEETVALNVVLEELDDGAVGRIVNSLPAPPRKQLLTKAL